MQVDALARQHCALIVALDAAGERGSRLEPGRQAEIDMQRKRLGFGGGAQVGLGQAIFAVAGDGDAGFARSLFEKFQLHAAPQKIVLLEMWAVDIERQQADGICSDAGQQWADRRQVLCGIGHVERGEDRLLHDDGLHRDRHFEDRSLVLDVAKHIVVVGLDGQLLLAAGDEDAGAGDDQRPQGAGFRRIQRIDGMIGADGRQDEERIAVGMMQQRRAGDGEIGGQPAVEDIAEIDDAVGDQPAGLVGARDDVVVGDVVMDRLDAQLFRQRLNAPDGGDHRLGDAIARLHIGNRLKEVQGDLAGAAQIPLQFALEAGMLEIGKVDGNAGGKRAEHGNSGFAEIFALRQWFAVEVGQQPHLVFVAANGEEQDVVAIAGLDGCRHARAVGFGGQMMHGGILGFQFDGRIFHAADFQHVAAFAGIEAVIAILLAAEFGDRAFQTVESVEDRRRFLRRHIRPWQLRALKERFVRHGIPRESIQTTVTARS